MALTGTEWRFGGDSGFFPFSFRSCRSVSLCLQSLESSCFVHGIFQEIVVSVAQ